jgi:hypothetical protein
MASGRRAAYHVGHRKACARTKQETGREAVCRAAAKTLQKAKHPGSFCGLGDGDWGLTIVHCAVCLPRYSDRSEERLHHEVFARVDRFSVLGHNPSGPRPALHNLTFRPETNPSDQIVLRAPADFRRPSSSPDFFNAKGDSITVLRLEDAGHFDMLALNGPYGKQVIEATLTR